MIFINKSVVVIYRYQSRTSLYEDSAKDRSSLALQEPFQIPPQIIHFRSVFPKTYNDINDNESDYFSSPFKL